MQEHNTTEQTKRAPGDLTGDLTGVWHGLLLMKRPAGLTPGGQQMWEVFCARCKTTSDVWIGPHRRPVDCGCWRREQRAIRDSQLAPIRAAQHQAKEAQRKADREARREARLQTQHQRAIERGISKQLASEEIARKRLERAANKVPRLRREPKPPTPPKDWAFAKARYVVRKTWSNIKRRCDSPKFNGWKNYGGRGIKICDGWRDFDNFFNAMGVRPDGATLDRKDNDGHYSCGACLQCVANGWPMNCRWATWTEQAQNRRNSRIYTFNGKTQTLAAWARETGLSHTAISTRLKAGQSVEDALTIPARNLGRRRKAA